MASAEINAKQAQFRVRPGLLLFFIVVLALAILDKTGLAASLAAAPVTAKRAVLLAATIATASGWFLLCKDAEPWRSWRIWITLAGAVVLTLSIPSYILYSVIPLKFILQFMPLSTAITVLTRWRDLLGEVAWIGPFFGHGRSRIAFVVGGTLMLLLWNFTWH
jgi:predicted neutral ceramidase superfamily lipid hydrolase